MKKAVVWLLTIAMAAAPLAAQAQEPKPGAVVMHGKGGSPKSRVIDGLASGLGAQGVLVANLDMPWSGARNYDVDAAAAEEQVREALERLRAGGASRLFVVGHSMGGAFALHLGGRLKLDGVVAIAPGGGSDNRVVSEKLGDSLEAARRYVAEGKGQERQRLMDFEGGRGLHPVLAVPAAYLSWFDPQGAMSQNRATRSVTPGTPVLFIVPTRDYPGLLRAKDRLFSALPPHPLTRLHEPDADHSGAPAAALDEIVRWMKQASAAQAK